MLFKKRELHSEIPLDGFTEMQSISGTQKIAKRFFRVSSPLTNVGRKESRPLGRKAQITVFIIIAIVLLFSAALVFYIRSRATIQEKEVIPVIEQVPVEFQPIQKYVDECLSYTATRGLEIIGRQGGYIDTSGFITNKYNPTESEALYLDKSTNLPYWYYLESQNDCSENCELTSNAPTLDQVALQLQDYIAAEITGCINNFKSFEEQGFKIKELEAPKASVTFADYDTKVVLTYPIEATREGRTRKLSKFYVPLPLQFKKIFTLAKQIEKIQSDTRFLEEHTRNLIVAFSDVNSELLVPWSGSRVSIGDREYWVKTNVKKDLENMLVYYTPFLGIYGTDTPLILTTDEFSQKVYEGMNKMNFALEETGDSSYANEKVTFFYRSDPNVANNIYFDLDCNGEICKPDVITAPILSWFGMGIQRYEFHYDLSYPVIVEIEDPAAFNGQGYFFAFAMESNIRRNNIMTGQFIDNSAVDLSREVSPCDPDQRNSGPVGVTVIDGATGLAIEDASLTYGVGNIVCEVKA